MSWVCCPFVPCNKTWPNPQSTLELAKHVRARHQGLRLTPAQISTYGFEVCDDCGAPFAPGQGGRLRHQKNGCRSRARSEAKKSVGKTVKKSVGKIDKRSVGKIDKRSVGMVIGEIPGISAVAHPLDRNHKDLEATGRCMHVIKRPRSSSSGLPADMASPGSSSPKRVHNHNPPVARSVAMLSPESATPLLSLPLPLI